MKRSMVVVLTIFVAILCVSVNVAVGKKSSPEPGEQTLTARWTDAPTDIDGTIGAGEYSAAIPVHVKFNRPTCAPGIVPDGIAPPENQDDLSYTIYAMYDEENLYIAVDVADDIVIDDGPSYSGVEIPWFDDDVEIFVDGDGVNNDFAGYIAGKEGFQLAIDTGGDAATIAHVVALSTVPGFWEAAVGLRPRGYVAEFEISLISIDTIDGDGEAAPGPGSSIGLNITVGDDDNGGMPYEAPEDSYGAWDGSHTNWSNSEEDDWGTLYFAPRPNGKAKRLGTSVARSSTWGQVKRLLK